MSATTASSTDSLETVHVKLTDEPVDVWRPVQARRLGPMTFQLLEQDIPEDEEWEFEPGERVVATEAQGDFGETYLRVVRADVPIGAPAE